jgi:hypothetical protein
MKFLLGYSGKIDIQQNLGVRSQESEVKRALCLAFRPYSLYFSLRRLESIVSPQFAKGILSVRKNVESLSGFRYI